MKFPKIRGGGVKGHLDFSTQKTSKSEITCTPYCNCMLSDFNQIIALHLALCCIKLHISRSAFSICASPSSLLALTHCSALNHRSHWNCNVCAQSFSLESLESFECIGVPRSASLQCMRCSSDSESLDCAVSKPPDFPTEAKYQWYYIQISYKWHTNTIQITYKYHTNTIQIPYK